jgi:hypothetical protein
MCTSPRVSVIITAFNLARYLPAAIDSALAQEFPGGSVQVIVVDDGSTDDTPEVLARYTGTVEIIRQANGGLVAAVDRGLRAVRGEYVALLDADDEWPEHRLRRHVEILEGNTLVGLVHGDMRVIDASGATIHPSFVTWKHETPVNGRILGELIKDNFVSGGASTFRASLLPAILPISPDAAYPDWWIATNIAAVAEIKYDPGISNLYRLHGANMGLGADPHQTLEIELRELPFRRWMMRHLLDDHTITVRDVGRISVRWRQAVLLAGLSHDGGVREIIPVDPIAAATALRAAAARPAGAERCKGLLRALSWDPLDGAVSADLEIALMRTSGPGAAEVGAMVPIPPPLITLEARPSVTLAWLDEVVAQPGLLSAFVEMSGTDEESTLVVLAAVESDMEPLISLVAADERLTDERCDIQVVVEPTTTPGRRWLAARSCARLTGRESAEPFGRLPVHDATEHAAGSTPDATPALAA